MAGPTPPWVTADASASGPIPHACAARWPKRAGGRPCLSASHDAHAAVRSMARRWPWARRLHRGGSRRPREGLMRFRERPASATGFGATANPRAMKNHARLDRPRHRRHPPEGPERSMPAPRSSARDVEPTRPRPNPCRARAPAQRPHLPRLLRAGGDRRRSPPASGRDHRAASTRPAAAFTCPRKILGLDRHKTLPFLKKRGARPESPTNGTRRLAC